MSPAGTRGPASGAARGQQRGAGVEEQRAPEGVRAGSLQGPGVPGGPGLPERDVSGRTLHPGAVPQPLHQAGGAGPRRGLVRYPERCTGCAAGPMDTRAGTIRLSLDPILSRFLYMPTRYTVYIAILQVLGFVFTFLTVDHGKKLTHTLLETVYHEAYFQKQVFLTFISAASLLY